MDSTVEKLIGTKIRYQVALLTIKGLLDYIDYDQLPDSLFDIADGLLNDLEDEQ
jgi:hypothetical protein